MPEFNREPKPEIAVEKRYTLTELRGLLTTNPEIFGDRLQEIRDAVEDAEDEVQRKGVLSQGTAELLDTLHRSFK